ncbi:MAG: hypothetical protein CMK07_10935 [Ponticaulis sp.]|nr:hypothetical protein [Ponticaulis sp.]
MTALLPTRRYDLDWLRVIAFLILILYHTGMFYVTWDWHVKSVHAGPDAEWLMMLTNPWRLSLLFFISGIALRFLADKGEIAGRMKERAFRLGLPIAFGMAIIVAPQSWLELVETGEFSGSFWAFWPQYLNFGSDFSIITPTWNHLWYVVYLLVYTMMLLPLATPVRRFMAARGGRWCAVVFSRKLGLLSVMALPVLPHVLIRLTLDPHFPTTHNLAWDWANHAHSLTMVVLGFVLAKEDTFWSTVRRAMPTALTLTITLGVGLSILWAQWDTLEASGDWNWMIWPARIARLAYAWLVILSLLGLSARFLNRDSTVLRYLTEAVFPWYILHQTITILAGFWLTRQGLSVGVEATLVILATILGCAVLHEVFIRRIGWVRPLFGLKPKTAVRESITVKTAL